MTQLVGEMLKKARLGKQLTLEESSLDLRIQKKYLEALEESNFGIFSSPIHVTGFIKNYSMYLGLNPSQVLAFYRRDFAGGKEDLENIRPVGASLPWFSPNRAAIIAVLLIFLAFFSYLFWQYSQFIKPPQLVVENPSGDVRVRSLEVTVNGRVSPEASLQINGQEIEVLGDGTFKETIALKGGVNTIKFTAINKSGRQVTIVRNIVVER